MIKKIGFILAYPFILLYYFLGFPFKIAWIILEAAINRPSKKSKNKSAKKVNFIEIGSLLFTGDENEFETSYNLYFTDKKQFLSTYPFDLPHDQKNLTPLEIIQAFGDHKQRLSNIDWRGEDDVNEIEEFITLQIGATPVWTNTISLRNSVNENRQRDGKFILKLFKAIDKDLQTINFRLLFLDMGWDAYIFLPTTLTTFDKVLEDAPNYFQCVDEL